MPLPRWIEPQFSKLVATLPSGPQWVHEIKFDGYRMAARIENGRVQLLTRSGLDWTAAAFAKLKVKTAYIDGELCGVGNGMTAAAIVKNLFADFLLGRTLQLEATGADMEVTKWLKPSV
jgi:bifunctional non-homologous end joining protein LigD